MGSGKGKQTIGYRYYMSIHMGISRGPVDELVQMDAGDVRAWPVPDGDSETVEGLMCIAQGPNGTGVAQYEDGSYETVSAAQINTISATGNYDINAPELFGGDKKEGGIVGTLRVMMGSASQIVPDWIKTLMGGRVPAFRGVTTLFFDGLLCSLNPYPKKWEWRVRRTVSGWDGDVWQPSIASIWLRGGTIKAMNPAHIIYECITNRDWGRGMPRSAIDDERFLASAQTLYNEDFGLCLRYTRQSELSAFIQNVVDHIGGSIYPDRSTGRLALDLLRGGYDLDNVPLFTYETGLISLDQAETATQDDIVNECIVKWSDPISKESERSARVQNLASRQATGAVNSTTTSYSGVPTVDLALRLAQRDVKANANSLKRYNVVLDRRAWRITPGAVFRISVPQRNIYNVVLRAGKITEQGGEDGRITVEAVMDVFGLPTASFIKAEESAWVPPNRNAMIPSRRIVREATYAELVVAMDPANLQILSDTAGTIAAVVGKPSTMSQGFDVSALAGGETEPTVGAGTFSPYIISTINIPVSADPIIIPFTESSDIGLVKVGAAVQMDGEIGRLDDIEFDELTGTGSITVARGCVDSVPQAHLLASTVYIFSDQVGGDGREYTSGETVEVQILPYTSTNKLSTALAPVDEIEIVGRQARPYPPGRVKVNGEPYYDAGTITGDLTLTWAHRNRVVQQDQLIDHDETSISPELGTTYTVRVYDGDTSSPVRTTSGIAGTTFVYTSAMAAADAVGSDIWFEIESVRDTLASFSKYRFGIAYGASGYGLSGYGDAYGE